MATRESFNVRQLVEDAGFEVELVGGADGVGRPCRGVYVGEHLDPTPWMGAGSVHLTTGLALSACGDPGEGVRLLRRLDAAGMAALGVSVPHYLQTIPESMRAEADRLGFPIFSVTGNTLFRDIEQYVYDMLASEELHRLRRSVSAQQQLLEIMAGEAAPAGLTARLAVLLQATALLLDARGAPLAVRASSGEIEGEAAAALAADVWAAYVAGDRDRLPRPAFVLASRPLLWREVVVAGRRHMVLTVLLPEDGGRDEFSDSILDYAQRLLEVDLRRRLPAARGGDGPLLRDLLRRSSGVCDSSERLARGILDEGAYRFVVVRAGGATGEPPVAAAADRPASSVVRTCEAAFGPGGAPFLLTGTTEGGAVALVAGDGEDREVRRLFDELAATLIAAGEECVVGVSGEHRDLRQAPIAYGHALQAAAAGAPPAAVCFDDLGPRRLALDCLRDDELEALVARVIAPLRAADGRGSGGLEESLRCYLLHDGALTEAAQALNVHRNTLCKRLARVERLLGLRLGTIDGLVNVALAFEAAAILWSRIAAGRF